MQKYSSPIKETDDENRQHSSMNDVSEEEDDNYSSDKYDGSSSSHVLPLLSSPPYTVSFPPVLPLGASFLLTKSTAQALQV